MIPITCFRIFLALIVLLTVAGTGAPTVDALHTENPAARGSPEKMTTHPLPPTASDEAKYEMIAGKEVLILPGYSKDRVIVRYKTEGKNTSIDLPPVMEAMNRRMGTNVVMDFSHRGVPGMQIIRTPNLSVEETVQSLLNNSDILYAEPDHLICLSPVEKSQENTSTGTGAGENAAGVVPDDPDYPLLWGLHNTGQSPFYGTAGADINAQDAWDVTTGSSSVVTAVIDTGVDYAHPDIVANIWTNKGEIPENQIDDDGNGYIDDIRGWNFVSDDNNPDDDNGHGTHCAGTIAAVGNNQIGVTGVCWKGSIMPLKFLDSSGNGYTSDAISAILYASQKGADVISLSWGGDGYSRSLMEAINESSAVVVCAAGNNGADSDTSPVYPAAYPSSRIISVAATDCNDELASFSNYGASSVDIAAPGVQIRSTWPDSRYRYLSGTSMATPHVSGVAALLKADDRTLTASAIKAKILDSADALPSMNGKTVSGGRLNAAAALGVSPESRTGKAGISGVGESGIQASFIAAPTKGSAPLTVQFLDSSSGGPSYWQWNFGDGGQSLSKNPKHTYVKPGTYTVTLKTNQVTGIDTASKIGYITVT